MKIFIIGNPISSGGNAQTRISKLTSILQNRGHKVQSYVTKFAGDGKKQISGIKDDIDRIVVVGGDGTFNEVVNGMPKNFSIPLVHFPTGNANLLAREFDLPTNPIDVVNLLENGSLIMADLAKMNDLKFIMIAGAGFDAIVTEELKKVRKGKVSNISYIFPVLRAFRSRPGLMFNVIVDDKNYVKGAIVLVCNVRNYAGLCEMAFEAGVNTGLLDIIVFPKHSIWAVLNYLVMAKFSRITKCYGVQYLKGKKVEITSDLAIPIQIDGDFVGTHEKVNIELMPERIPIIVP